MHPVRLILILVTAALVGSGCTQDSQRRAQKEEQARQAQREAVRERGTVRVITHPTNPMIVYVTTLPDPHDWRRRDDDPKVKRLAVVDLSTGQWRELDLAGQLPARFGLDHPRVYLEVVRTGNELTVTRE